MRFAENHRPMLLCLGAAPLSVAVCSIVLLNGVCPLRRDVMENRQGGTAYASSRIHGNLPEIGMEIPLMDTQSFSIIRVGLPKIDMEIPVIDTETSLQFDTELSLLSMVFS